MHAPFPGCGNAFVESRIVARAMSGRVYSTQAHVYHVFASCLRNHAVEKFFLHLFVFSGVLFQLLSPTVLAVLSLSHAMQAA